MIRPDKFKLSLSFLVFLNILGFCRMFFPGMRLGLITSMLLIVLIFFFWINVKKVRLIDNFPFFLIVLFQFLSMIQYILNPVSSSYLSANTSIIFTFISFLIIPQIGFFSVGAVLSRKEDFLKKTYSIIGRIHFFTFLAGLFLFFLRPNFYQEYLYVVQSNFYEVETWFYPRLVSYLDTSMILGIVGTFSFVLIYYFEPKTHLKYFMLITVVIGVIMTLSRGAWVSLSMSILLIVLKEFLRLNYRLLLFSIFSAILIVVIFLSFNQQLSIIADLSSRVESLGSSIGERSDQWERIIDQINHYPGGFGLGLTSHKSVGFDYIVPDGNYFRILGDIGFLGSLFFLLFFFYALFQSFIKSYPLFIILVAFFFQAIGTNVFDLYYAGYYFWLFMGITYNLPLRE